MTGKQAATTTTTTIYKTLMLVLRWLNLNGRIFQLSFGGKLLKGKEKQEVACRQFC